MSKKFKRRSWTRLSRLGKNRKNKQTWRRAKGRHNKVREKRKGYPIKVMIGFRQEQGKSQPVVTIYNLTDMEKIQKGDKIMLGKVGQKKKIEIAKKAKEKGLQIENLNVNKILKNIEEKNKPKENKK